MKIKPLLSLFTTALMLWRWQRARRRQERLRSQASLHEALAEWENEGGACAQAAPGPDNSGIAPSEPLPSRPVSV